jgi:methylenetetrahydrofolate--tRNA-(uracil-5-)-methyltransferase
MQLKEHNEIFLAGQLSGVEGYIESSASAILAAINATRYYNNQQLIELPTSTVLGSLINYICNASSKDFKPMNSNYGIMVNRSKDKLEIAKKSLEDLNNWKELYHE